MAILSTKLPWSLANTKWASVLNPVLSLPILQGNQVDSIALVANKPMTINHGLNQLPVGWIIVDKSANANVWRTQPFTTTTLTLESSANTTISLYVY